MRAGTRVDRVRWAIVYCVGVLLAWALVAGRLGRWRITAPMVVVFGGMIIGLAGLVVQAGAVVGGGEQLPETVDLAIVTTVLNRPNVSRVEYQSNCESANRTGDAVSA